MSHPLVTIPITAYRTRQDHLSMAIESALSQSWREIEIIVADDSPDQSLKPIVDRFGDPRIRYRHNSPRLGSAGNLWSCFREAQGEYIAVLNHDDQFSPSFLERLARPLMEDPKLALAFSDHWVMDGSGRRLPEETDRVTECWGRSNLPEGKYIPFHLLLAAQSIPMDIAALFRRDLLPNSLPDHAGPAYDLWLAYLLCRTGQGAYYVPERLTSWRAHADNLTSQGGLDWSHGTAECWRMVSCDADFSSIRRVARRKAAVAYCCCAIRAWREGRKGSCLNYGWQSLRMKPTWKGLLACLLPALPVRFAKHR